MGVSAVSNLPLNHYLTDDPVKAISKLKCKAFTYNFLEKISWVAITAIMAAVFSIYYSGVVLTGWASAGIIAMIFSAPFLMAFLPGLRSNWTFFSQAAQREERIQQEFQQIAHWRTPEIRQFLREQGINEAQIPLANLQQLQPQEPLVALLPLIARFRYLKAQSEELENASRTSLADRCEQIQDLDNRRFHRLLSRQLGYAKHEHEAIPKAMDAAILLQTIQEPSKEIDLTHLGRFRAKSFEERMFDRTLEPTDDAYFDLSNGTHLTLAQIEATRLAPRDLRLLLIPGGLRA